MFKYPCNAFNVEKKVYTGHSSHVTNVTLLDNDSTVISTGGNDSAIMQWRVTEEAVQ
jgi:microtubule-associated protein-like 1/2